MIVRYSSGEFWCLFLFYLWHSNFWICRPMNLYKAPDFAIFCSSAKDLTLSIGTFDFFKHSGICMQNMGRNFFWFVHSNEVSFFGWKTSNNSEEFLGDSCLKWNFSHTVKKWSETSHIKNKWRYFFALCVVKV